MSTTIEQPDFLTVRELAGYLRISLRTAYQLVYDGDVPAVKVASVWRIPRTELDTRLGRTPGKREPGFDRAQGSREDVRAESTA